MKPLGIALLHLAALALGTYQAYRPTIESRFAHTQWEPGDGLLNNYLLEHTWRAISDPDYPGTLASPPFFYPTPHVLWYSETMLGAAPVYWVLRFGLPPDLAFQWWQMLMSVLNYAAFAWVCRRLGCEHLLAAFGGYLWAYGLVHIHQSMHQQMIPRFWMPVAAYHAWQLVLGANLRSMNRLCACVFLQCITCVYTGWFLVAGLAVFVPVAAMIRPGGLRELAGFAWRRRRAVAGVLGLWGLVFTLYFLPYAIVNAGHARPREHYTGSLPIPATWLSGPTGSRWHATIRPWLPDSVPNRLFSGFGVYLLAGGAAAQILLMRRATRSPELTLVAASLVVAGVWVLLTLNLSDGRSAWSVVRFVPGAEAIRRVDRVAPLVYLFLTLAGIVWLKQLTERIPARWLRGLLTLAVVAPVVYEQTGFVTASFPKAEFYPLAQQYAAELRGADVGYLVPRPPQPHLPHQLYGDVLGMWAGMYANVPVVNGYSGRYPDDYPLYSGDAEAELRAWLRGRFRGRVAIIDPNEPGNVRHFVIEE